jgi:hypothetical protein
MMDPFVIAVTLFLFMPAVLMLGFVVAGHLEQKRKDKDE